jgi:signal transduction histidine kinase
MYIVACVLSAFALPAVAGAPQGGEVWMRMPERQASLSELGHRVFRASESHPAWINFYAGNDAKRVLQAQRVDGDLSQQPQHHFESPTEDGGSRAGEREALLAFHVATAFYQTVWFRALVALLVVGLFALIAIVRTEKIDQRIRQLIAVRTYERERIARDLHDTLLQGVQSLLLRTNVWANDRSLPDNLRSEMYKVSEQARELVVEARERIVLLRNGDSKDSDLIATLTRMANARTTNEAPSMEIISRGAPRPLTDDVYQQLVDITQEAVRNAIQHANCQRVRVTVAYQLHSISLAITDDGCGITPTLLLSDTLAGHYGILGMQERAQQLGAAFSLGPDGISGTRVSVHVPAEVAFADTPCRSNWYDLAIRWWRRRQARLFQ